MELACDADVGETFNIEMGVEVEAGPLSVVWPLGIDDGSCQASQLRARVELACDADVDETFRIEVENPSLQKLVKDGESLNSEYSEQGGVPCPVREGLAVFQKHICGPVSRLGS